MGLFDNTRGQFIDVIEWVDSSRETLVWRQGLQGWTPAGLGADAAAAWPGSAAEPAAALASGRAVNQEQVPP
jgi:membrane protease subunit (stomatin/prohibitin family)